MGKVVRVRCPLCGHRLNQGDLHRATIRLGVDDILLQEIGGRGIVRNLGRWGFNSPDGRIYGDFFLAKVRVVERMLSRMMGSLSHVGDVVAGRLFATFRAEPSTIVSQKGTQYGVWKDV